MYVRDYVDPGDEAYFEHGAEENERFWRRLGTHPDVRGLAVLDLGCGHGRLCFDLALAGAQRVVGVDLDHHRISFAQNKLAESYPELRDVVSFREIDVRELDEGDFDMIVSKDTFEHVLDLPSVFDALCRQLKPGGRMYLGIGPLYNAPWGDHGRTRMRVPWGHLLLPEPFIVRRLNRQRSEPIASIEDLGLNKWPFRAYASLFKRSGLEIEYFGVNVSDNLGVRAFSYLRRVPYLTEYFSENLYVIARKPEQGATGTGVSR